MTQRLAITSLLLLLLALAACAAPGATFATPEEALQALVDSAEDRTRADELLGPGGFEVLRSGDDVADREDLETVRALIREKIAFEDDGDDRRIALLGPEGWPLPLPLVRAGSGWRFDVDAGKEEILNRRIGRNELHAVATLRACVEAQHEYAAVGRDGQPPAFAARWRSREGRRDGLFWPVGDGETPSPLGPLVAAAAREGYDREDGGDPEPFHGYHFRILTEQGRHAPGGARSYLDADGRLTGGFAVLAWPATWGNSGVMTFVVDRRGLVFERDLGRDTALAAKAITAFDPDPSWQPVVD
ncbi:MAG: DUF2950 domain-containing protein [Planctomycetes bacterium]|nr:DUF2950 domain-containing protein [Planctomycetota bacterium]